MGMCEDKQEDRARKSLSLILEETHQMPQGSSSGVCAATAERNTESLKLSIRSQQRKKTLLWSADFFTGCYNISWDCCSLVMLITLGKQLWDFYTGKCKPSSLISHGFSWLVTSHRTRQKGTNPQCLAQLYVVSHLCCKNIPNGKARGNCASRRYSSVCLVLCAVIR